MTSQWHIRIPLSSSGPSGCGARASFIGTSADQRQCVLKMADGLCTGDPVGNVIEKTLVKNYNNVMVCETNDSVNDVACEKVNAFYIASASDKLFDKLCGNTTDGSTKHEGFLSCEDDCRKKRCVDRYDSSESSDR